MLTDYDGPLFSAPLCIDELFEMRDHQLVNDPF